MDCHLEQPTLISFDSFFSSLQSVLSFGSKMTDWNPFTVFEGTCILDKDIFSTTTAFEFREWVEKLRADALQGGIPEGQVEDVVKLLNKFFPAYVQCGFAFRHPHVPSPFFFFLICFLHHHYLPFHMTRSSLSLSSLIPLSSTYHLSFNLFELHVLTSAFQRRSAANDRFQAA